MSHSSFSQMPLALCLFKGFNFAWFARMGGLFRDRFPQTAKETNCMCGSLDHNAGFTLERKNTWWPPCFSPSTALSTPNRNLMPLGHSAASRSFRQTSHMDELPCQMLDTRPCTLNPWVKVCTARTLSRRWAISLGSRMMLMRFFSARREGTVLIWSSNSMCKVEGGYQRSLLVVLTESQTCLVRCTVISRL